MSAAAQEVDAAPYSGRMPKQKPHRSCQTYGTPWAFIRAVERRFGPIVCDLAAVAENAKAKEWIGPLADTLVQPWAERYPTGNLWLNPQFGNIEPCAEKCWRESRERQGLILMLTPASIGTDWFANHVHRKAVVLALSPRLTFEGCSDPYPKDLMLSVYGASLSGFDCWRWKGEARE